MMQSVTLCCPVHMKKREPCHSRRDVGALYYYVDAALKQHDCQSIEAALKHD